MKINVICNRYRYKIPGLGFLLAYGIKNKMK